jgi:hypothetical protein
MGYSHYFYVPQKFETETFAHFALDVQKIIEFSEQSLGIELANGLAEPGSKPEITLDRIVFNGSDQQTPGQWTTNEEIIIPWPAPTASTDEPVADPAVEKAGGTWYAGTLLKQRTAPICTKTGKGLGSYETFHIERKINPEEYFGTFEPGEKIYHGVKTAYRPYDIIVTAVLIALKNHFADEVTIKSDGEGKDWIDGRMLCQNLLGYGLKIELD